MPKLTVKSVITSLVMLYVGLMVLRTVTPRLGIPGV